MVFMCMFTSQYKLLSISTEIIEILKYHYFSFILYEVKQGRSTWCSEFKEDKAVCEKFLNKLTGQASAKTPERKSTKMTGQKIQELI